jgi:death-on-curing protein
LATEETSYLTYPEAILIHFETMDFFGEIRYGIFDRDLLESILARPQQAAVYDNADLVRQAATFYFGLIKSHPWIGGNKRTASALVELFLKLNGWRLTARLEEKIALVYEIEAGRFGVDEIEDWLRQRVTHTKESA